MSREVLRAGESIIIKPINDRLEVLMKAHTFTPPGGVLQTPWDRIPAENWFTGGEENYSDHQFPHVSIYMPDTNMVWRAIGKRKGWDGTWIVQFGFQDFTQADMLIGYEFIEQLDKLTIQDNRLFAVQPTVFKTWEAVLTNATLEFDEDFLFGFIICTLNIKIQRCDI